MQSVTNDDLVLANTADLRGVVSSAKAYAAASRAEKTRTTYDGEWKAFTAWCARQGFTALPAEGSTVALYLTSLADRGRKAAGIEVALVAISQAHKLGGCASPREQAVVQQVRKGIRRTIGTAQKGKAALRIEELRAAVEALPTGLRGVRDRAVLLLAFAGALRRSELVGLDVEDVKEVPEGLRVTLRRSKTDQEGAGQVVAIPKGTTPATCPVGAVRGWLAASGRTQGPLFVSVDRWQRTGQGRLAGNDVARLVKRAATAAGLPTRELAGHSLRAGLATAAARAGKSERAIMKQTRHTSLITVRKYIREADLFVDNAAEGIGL